MRGIKLLDKQMINNIAAGEVIERPASIVKELIENSIDALATSITVEIKNGGIDYIRVTDNGIGIPKDDLAVAFLRHSTSKIRNMTDLENILTMGFRGEALASISSVSMVDMVTKTSDDDSGTVIILEAGEVIEQKSFSAIQGTSVNIKNLFYNVPARKKFLKKASVESSYIMDYIIKLSLGNPGISFKYINNDSTIISTKGNNDLFLTIFQLYGKEVSENIIKIGAKKEEINIYGFIGKPEIARGNRKYQHTFINKRFVKDKLIRLAVEEAFKGKIMSGKFPVFFINIEIPPYMVDVNVHPNKTEVRFSDDNIIYKHILELVENYLKKEVLIPKVQLSTKNNEKNIEAKNNYSTISLKENEPIPILNEIKSVDILKEMYKSNKNINEENYFKNSTSNTNTNNFLNESSTKKIKIDTNMDLKADHFIDKKENKQPFFYNYIIKGQIFGTYWIVEQSKSIYLIDQHAIHEKILYEEISKSLKSNKISSQRLLSEVFIRLNLNEVEIVKDNIEILYELGFDVSLLDANTLVLKSIPFIIKGDVNESFFLEILDILSSDYSSVSNIYDTKKDLIASLSCKSAIKANDKMSYTEARELIEKALKMDEPFNCPHGRPTIIEITNYEIEKKFKRV